jgi:hypothetical protein
MLLTLVVLHTQCLHIDRDEKGERIQPFLRNDKRVTAFHTSLQGQSLLEVA